MSVQIPEKKRALLQREKKAFASIAFVRKDGSPQVTPIWFDWDGKHVIVNTARGRVKDKVLHKHPRVSLAIIDPDNPYNYLEIRGRVAEETEEGAADMIRSLNEKYHGKFEYPLKPGEVRVTYRIIPEQVSPNW